jgi:hypothetical protein
VGERGQGHQADSRGAAGAGGWHLQTSCISDVWNPLQLQQWAKHLADQQNLVNKTNRTQGTAGRAQASSYQWTEAYVWPRCRMPCASSTRTPAKNVRGLDSP